MAHSKLFIEITRAVAILALGLLAACSETVLISTPSAEPPTRVDAIIEVITDHPTIEHTVDFGEVYAGQSREKEIIVKNVGTNTLQVHDLVLSDGGSFTITNDDAWERLLNPDATTSVFIEYSPLRDETMSGTLTVESNDRENSQIEVDLLAEGLAPAIDIQPPSYDFGNPELGCVRQLDITISNIGRAPLTLDSIEYEDLGGNSELTLVHGIDDGTDLDPDESVSAQVHYVPIDVQPDTGVLTVISNDPSNAEETATQFGIAHLGATNTDEYQQEGDNSTDILFVVDNSCSMGEEQSSMAVNFASFIQIVDALEINYNIGVATTDVSGDAGQLQGTVPIVSPSTPDPAGTFSVNVNLGTGGAGIEQGLHGGYLALSSPMIDPGGWNEDFLRESASGLRIIFVSDEQEQSNSIMGWAPADYVDFFVNLKENPDHVVISDITGGMSGCSGAGGSASSGSDYVTATNMSNGISASICDPNWVSTLSALAWLSQSFADTFELSQTPVEDTIEVRLNGVPIYVGWVYDSALQAIVFDVDHIPENGDELEFEYTVLGDCAD